MSVGVITYLQRFRQEPIVEKDQEIILSFFESASYKEGEFLFREGKVCSQLFYVCSGILRIVSSTDKGVDRTHYFYKENQVCTILKSFSEQEPSDAGIQAACEVEVRVISRQRLQELYQLLPYMEDVIGKLFQQQLLEKVTIRCAFLGVDAETQYRIFLEQQPEIALRVSIKDIASYLGITPQSLSRIRRNIH